MVNPAACQEVEPIKTLKIMNTSVETKKNEVRNNIENMFESATEKFKDIIAVCPDWEVEDVDVSYASILLYLKLKGVESSRQIEVRYQAKGRWQDESFETNVAACGSFDLLEASDNLKYYTAVGSILSHKDMLSSLKEAMAYYTRKIADLREI